jgi:hypothetical protein
VSRIEVTVGTASVSIHADEWKTGAGQMFGGAFNPHDLIYAAIKALRAIDTDVATALADGLGQMPVSGGQR